MEENLNAKESEPRLLTDAQVREAMAALAAACPEPKTELNSTNAYTLLVAVMLSAQMTDAGVNKATAALFAVADTPAKMLELGEEGLKAYISSINLYPTKARRIIEASRLLVERFAGEVPSTREELESLPGVGRKTANVVLNCAFGQPVIPVDTHVLRVSNRLGLSCAKTPAGVEADLMSKIPPEYLKDAHHLILLHGRHVCRARSPRCGECCVAGVCYSALSSSAFL